jgi:polyhydroxybutyrate depolymerase
MTRILRRLGWAALVASSVVLFAALALQLTTPGPSKPPETTGRLLHAEMQWEGRTRSWLTYRPSRLKDPAALVLALPGSGQSAEDLRTATNFGFEALADRNEFLLVYVDAWQEGSLLGPEWNDCRKHTSQPAHLEGVDDVGFVLRVLEATAHAVPVDPARVYAAGVSDGGQMAYRLATEHPDRFAAIAAVVAQQPTRENSSCTEPLAPISVLVMNGTEDPVIPYAGGEASFHGLFSAGEVQSAEETISYWKQVNGISGQGTRDELPDRDPEDGSTVVRERWRDAGSGHEVVLYSIMGGGHSIPGGYRGAPDFLLGVTNRDIDATEEIWAFFERHRLR